MKIIIYILLITNLLYAKDISSVEIIENNNFNFNTIKSVEGFQKTNSFIKFNSSKDYWLKITFIDKIDFSKKDYILTINSKLSINPVIFENNEFFIENSAIEIKNKDIIYSKISAPIGEINLKISIKEKNNYLEDLMKRKELYSISYGIIFAAFFYYFAFFIFNKEKSFIYYSLTQFFILFMIYFSDKQYCLSYGFYDFIVFGFLISSNLFTKEFLNTKKYTPFLDKVLTVLFFVAFLRLIISFPDSLFLLIYIICAVTIYIKTNAKPIIFYIIGWTIIILTYIFVEFLTDFIKQDIDPIFIIDFIHIIAPLESLIFAFALSYKMKINENEKEEKQRLLIHQSRLSSLGEMISNITHQWRQSLTHLGYIFININAAFKHNKLDKTYLENKICEANNQLQYMSETLEDFKNFYSPKKEKKDFSALKYIQKALTIFSSSLQVNNINIKIIGDDFYIYGYENEFSQVILNLLTNAKDIFIEKKIKNPEIKIVLEERIILISDNAGGIDKKIEEKIFEPYFSTKPDGSGIGLYMSKTIIEKSFQGKLYFKNSGKDSLFFIDLR